MHQPALVLEEAGCLDWGVPIAPEANLRGLDPATPSLEGRPPSECLTELARFLDGTVPVGHRLETYDVPVLLAAFELVGLPAPRELLLGGNQLDTRSLAVLLFEPGASLRLESLAGEGARRRSRPPGRPEMHEHEPGP